METVTMDMIERAARQYSDAYRDLGDLARNLESEIQDIKNQHMRAIRSAMNTEAKRKEELRSMVSHAPHLFEKPRTQVFHNIKVGYQKGKGTIEIDNPDLTVELIRKNLPDAAENLITTKSFPRKTEIERLSAADLKKIACRIDGDGEMVIIKPADTDTEKLIRALKIPEKE